MRRRLFFQPPIFNPTSIYPTSTEKARASPNTFVRMAARASGYTPPIKRSCATACTGRGCSCECASAYRHQSSQTGFLRSGRGECGSCATRNGESFCHSKLKSYSTSHSSDNFNCSNKKASRVQTGIKGGQLNVQDQRRKAAVVLWIRGRKRWGGRFMTR